MKKIAIVTGASSGLGSHFVRQLDLKYNLDEIWMVARRENKMKKIASKLKKTKAILIKCDLSNLDDINKTSNKLKKEKAKVMFLINSAGFGKIGSFHELSLEEQMAMIDVNIKALTAITYKVLPYLSKGSKIIQVASSAAFLPQPGFNVYAATKAYVLHFSKALSVELKSRNIGVLALCPGPVKTEFFEIASSDGKPLDWKAKFMVNAKDVVAKALNDAQSNKMESVYSFYMKLLKISSKIIPHELILKYFKWN
ncbi:MAG TPA: SDR family NAD(P)-dependent oxidoreductase [Defluviitaleaceae bacterium]|jgi:short-subunit dehydrogenase|nr:SDR family NAD(P)-dependent oxidoreductase [Candidatus Epulonipiscium sp.]HOA81541.1 SDR family NAD(P)-dependent oxidoreductase [Defluviitaleaceae bacterium]